MSTEHTVAAEHSTSITAPVWWHLPRRLMLLICLAPILGSVLAACDSTPNGSTVQQPSSFHFILEGKNTTQSSNGLRETLVALDASNGHVAWKHELDTPAPDDGVFAPYLPVYQDGLVYVGYRYMPLANPLGHSMLEALDAATGQTRWHQEVDAGHVSDITGPPIVVNSVVYLSAGVFQTPGQGGIAVAFDARSGNVRWRRALVDLPKMPVLANGNLYLITGASQSFNGDLLALRIGDGSTAWDHASSVPLMGGGDQDNLRSTAPIVAGQLIYVQALQRLLDGSADLVQLAVRASDGTLAWQFDTGGGAATPTISQDGATLCLGVTTFTQSTGGASGVVALATTNGQKRWSETLPKYSSGCVASGDTFLVNTGSFAGAKGTLLALSSQDGHHQWEITTGQPVDADGVLSPTAANGMVVDVVVPSDKSSLINVTLVVARVSDGAVLWRHEFAGHVETMADIEGDQLYSVEVEQQNPQGIVVAYSLSTGAPLWKYSMGNS